MGKIQASLRELERRHWWLWSAAILGLALLSAALFFPGRGVSWEENPLGGSGSRQAVLAALGLLSLVTAYVIHALGQQKLLRRLEEELTEELAEKSKLITEVEGYHRLAMMDPVTDLYNRRYIDQHLEAELARCQRHGYPLNVLKLDLKHFVRINETHGHSAGDLVLRCFAERLKKSLRNSDVTARIGSDEFLVLLPESSPERVPHILARLNGLEADFRGVKIPVTFSAGWTSYQAGETTEQLLERVGQEVRTDKHEGRSEEAIRRAQTEFRQIQNIDALERLAGKVAHDFNNMFNLVKGYSELVLECLGRTDPLREYIEQIHTANERASSLTRQLLAFGHQPEATPQGVDLNALLVSMEGRLRRLMGEKVQLNLLTGDCPGVVKGDRENLEEIILNLARHARDTMPQGGTLTLETQNVQLDEVYARWHPGAHAGSYILLTAQDTGTALDTDTRARIFEPFLTLKGRSKRTGLGLTTVYEIVKQSGGYVWVDSDSTQGTMFKIYLLRAEETVEAA